MFNKIFVNLPVNDLDASMAFFKNLGFHFNPQFTDETAACLVISDSIYAMLLTEEKFRTFTPKAICDARSNSEVLIALAGETREEVEQIVANAVKAGGKTYAEPKDYGFMYQHGFEDLDGHIWEVVYMDMSQFPKE